MKYLIENIPSMEYIWNDRQKIFVRSETGIFAVLMAVYIFLLPLLSTEDMDKGKAQVES